MSLKAYSVVIWGKDVIKSARQYICNGVRVAYFVTWVQRSFIAHTSTDLVIIFIVLSREGDTTEMERVI
jgi:hypothetical protein